MIFKLYGPIYDDGPVATFNSFKAAVLAGQKRFGHGQFHVEAPESYAPSREEQLLEEVNPGGKKRGNVEFESVQQIRERKEIEALRHSNVTQDDW